MPKTGGTWLRHYMIQHKTHQKHGHSHADRVLQRAGEDVRLFGTIRDPWTWYASWYHHCKRVTGNAEILSQYGKTFVEVLPNLLGKSYKSDNFAVITGSKDLAKWLAFDGGLYSFFFQEFFQGKVDVFIDTAQLYEGCELLFGAKVPASKFPPQNNAAGKLREYPSAEAIYTPELIELVREKDGPLAEKLGFTPFSKSSKGAVIRLD